MITRFIAGVALASATLLASPALAKSARASKWNAHDAHAQSYFSSRPAANRYRRAHPSWNVYNTYGRYVGSDPDPNVRDMIARDRVQQLNGGY